MVRKSGQEKLCILPDNIGTWKSPNKLSRHCLRTDIQKNSFVFKIVLNAAWWGTAIRKIAALGPFFLSPCNFKQSYVFLGILMVLTLDDLDCSVKNHGQELSNNIFVFLTACIFAFAVFSALKSTNMVFKIKFIFKILLKIIHIVIKKQIETK